MALVGSWSKLQAYWTSDPLLAQIRTSKSITFWARPEPSNSANEWCICSWHQLNFPFEGGTSNQGRMKLEITAPTVAGNVRIRRRWWNAAGSGSFSDGIDLAFGWHHFALVFNGTQVTTYIDGTVYIAAGNVPDVESGVFILGGAFLVPSNVDSLSPIPMVNGRISDLAVWNGQLSAGEVATLYAAGAPAYSRTSTTVPGVSLSMTLRCPLQSNVLDVVTGNPEFASNDFEQFVDDSDLWGAGRWDGSDVITRKNPGIASKFLTGQTRGQLFLLSDSFGGISQGRLPAALYNRLAMGRFGSIASMNSGGIVSVSTTGAAGTITAWTSAQNHRVEAATTRTITANTYSGTTKTVTYNGPNLVTGQTIRIGSAYYTVSSFTPGSGVGVSQTGAQASFTISPDPGNLVGQNVQSCLVLLGSGQVEVFDNGSSTRYVTVSAQPVTDLASTPEAFNSGACDRITEDSTKTATIRIYHRIASDVSQQVKSVIVRRVGRAGVLDTVATLTGLDNPADAGKIKVIEVPNVPINQTTGFPGTLNFGVVVDPSPVAADKLNRYFSYVMAEVELDSSELRLVDFAESSASPTGLVGQAPGNKTLAQDDINRFVSAAALPGKQAVIAINMDLEDRADWSTVLSQTKTAWDSAFAAAGLSEPRYLLWGSYLHNTGPTTSLAVWRWALQKFNRACMDFAAANPNRVEFFPIADELSRWEAPRIEVTGVASPAPVWPYVSAWRIDPRHIVQRLGLTGCSWDQATLTLTRSTGFRDCVLSLNGNSFVYCVRNSTTSTPVVAGWYPIVSATPNSLVLGSSITGGAAGVAADVNVIALAMNGIGLHTGGFWPSVIADVIFSKVASAINHSEYEAATPGLCTVRFVVLTGAGAAAGAGYKIEVALQQGSNHTLDSSIASRVMYQGTTNASGIADLVLIRRDAFTRGGVYSIKIRSPQGEKIYDNEAYCPNESFAFSSDLIDA